MKDLESLQTLGDIARLQGKAHADKTALIFQQQRISYAALNRRTNQAANGLLSLGVAENERVCYLGKNSLCYFELLLALSKAGAVMVPLNWRLAPAELASIIADTQAQLVFVTVDFLDVMQEVKLILTDQSIRFLPVEDHEQWLEQFGDDEPVIAASYEADVLQLYTSGTTGKPKGVRISNRALLCGRAREIDPDSPDWIRWHFDDVSLIAMPCFHIGGTGFGLNTLYAGATGVIMKQFEAQQQLDLMVEYGITKHFIVPAALRIVLDDERVHSTNLSALKYISYGASPIPLDLMKECIEVFGCGFVQKYGMTETSGSVVALGPEDHTIPENPKMKSVGKALSQVEIKIVDTNGESLATGETGEIVVRSATNMSGYWHNTRASEDAYFPGGWLRTGDAGYLDEDAYLYIRDRIKDMIVSGGENVYSAEVEAALKENPFIADAAVFGIPDEKWGEAVTAYVVLNKDAVTDEASVIAHCRGLIAGYKTPKSVKIVEALPRNAAGKVLKQQLRDPYWVDHGRKVN